MLSRKKGKRRKDEDQRQGKASIDSVMNLGGRALFKRVRFNLVDPTGFEPVTTSGELAL